MHNKMDILLSYLKYIIFIFQLKCLWFKHFFSCSILIICINSASIYVMYRLLGFCFTLQDWEIVYICMVLTLHGTIFMKLGNFIRFRAVISDASVDENDATRSFLATFFKQKNSLV